MNSDYEIKLNLKWWFLAKHETGYWLWARVVNKAYKPIFYIYPPGKHQ